MNEQSLNNISLTARVLGAAFYYSPNEVQDIIGLLSSPQWAEDWPYGSAEQKQTIGRQLAVLQTDNESLDEAYQRLFIGPYALPSPPWGSVWLDKENVIFGDSTLQLREWMQHNHIDICLTQNEPEDHFGLMLMMVAWVAENEPLKLNELLAQHLLPWAFHYLNKLQANANFPFYVGLAELAQLTLTGWQNSLKIDVADKEIFFR
ncbi:Tat proofreading chaperone DmsD [Providencia stuartii]|uniref:Tat proofreading chaperone DmsD n=1 Tax=Providencia TaxID=586 RepID=UPI0024B15668|nr:Tat proofreading chaperone DmsD [Providencia sp. 2023EL-00965]ELR5042090.1 Tat proofreading chaperone DmsD [Providencia stuartii]ELR5083601.1 Tat proofreading chaperone DmsD [Providencia stuartii]ELR5302082.1 Tat proofreading chaperone DmsD [Providencia stuartii]MDW7590494.1 Tat proofreading chaperone DmsD [Providencia sp. 2023EL-00965]